MELSGQIHVSAAFTLGKETPVPIRRKTELTPEPVYTFLRREKFNAPAGNQTSVHPLCSLIKIPFFHYTRIQLLALWASNPYAVYAYPPFVW